MLLARGLVEERIAEDTAEADPAHNTLWRNGDEGSGILLRTTPAGRDALGIESRQGHCGRHSLATGCATRSIRAFADASLAFFSLTDMRDSA